MNAKNGQKTKNDTRHTQPHVHRSPFGKKRMTAARQKTSFSPYFNNKTTFMSYKL
jgi:hypothetical protein